jgi:hypothetical protein
VVNPYAKKVKPFRPEGRRHARGCPLSAVHSKSSFFETTKKTSSSLSNNKAAPIKSSEKDPKHHSSEKKSKWSSIFFEGILHPCSHENSPQD